MKRLLLLALALLFGNNVFSQEWEAVYYSDEIISGCDYLEAVEEKADMPSMK